MTKVISNENRCGALGNNGTRKGSKPNSLPWYWCLRVCKKSPLTLVNIYRDSPGLRSLVRWLLAVSSSIFLLCAIPLSFYPPRSTIQKSLNLRRTLEEIFIGWTTLLAINPWYLVVLSFIVGFSLARDLHKSKLLGGERGLSTVSESSDTISLHPSKSKVSYSRMSEILRRPDTKKVVTVLVTALLVSIVVGIQSNLHMIYPSWLWNPLLIGYNVYWPRSIKKAMNGLCVEKLLPDTSVQNQKSLCLPEQSWRELSTDKLSSKNKDDRENVMNGVQYLKEQSGGIIFATMSRDTITAIQPLRDNVESMLPFTNKLAVVVFENDSTDGSREAFLQWSKDVTGNYTVDVIECKDSPGCKFEESHRDLKDGIPHEKTSAIGRMHEFRQRVVDHILLDSKYSAYSHFLVLDIDLFVSVSPLGILHSLGVKPNDAIASSGRQARPGSLGSLQPPYDFSAFVAHESEENKRMINLNKKFCGLKPEGYRWRNECTAVSVAQYMMIERGDKLHGGKPYVVDSAFNGAVLYPIKLVRESKAKYDSGMDGQRCEHVGFNLSLKQPMYMNPKWNMQLHPHLMAGPSGKRALRILQGITASPKILPFAIGVNVLSIMIFMYCIINLTMLIVYPLWVYVYRSTVGGSSLFQKTFIRERSASPSLIEFEFLVNSDQNFSSRKRKDSEFDKDQCNIDF